jgi:hypothetical protein
VIRFVLLMLVALFVAWCSTTVNLGDYTFAGHVKRIWQSEETQDLKEGVKEKATSESTKELVDDIKDKTEPVVDRVKRGVEAGVNEASETRPVDEVKDAAREAADKADGE